MITIKLTKKEIGTILNALYIFGQDWIEEKSKEAKTSRQVLWKIEDKLYRAILPKKRKKVDRK